MDNWNQLPIHVSTENSTFLKKQPRRRLSKGEVRIRSNICARSDDWHLVPGELLDGFEIPLNRITIKQHDEMMYYVPCCLCHRTIFQIHEEGCDHPTCRRQGIPSRTEAGQKIAMVKAGDTGSETVEGHE